MKQTFVDRLTTLRTEMWFGGLETYFLADERISPLPVGVNCRQLLARGGIPCPLSSLSVGTQ